MKCILPILVSSTLAGTALAPLSALASSSASAWPPGVEIGEIEDGTVHFRIPDPASGDPAANGATRDLAAANVPPPLQTRLKEIEPLGMLHPAEPGVPFVLLSGRACAGTPCHEPRTIYMIRADGTEHHEFTYPGKISDPKSRRLLYSSDAYFGKCLPGWGDIYVNFQEEKVDRRLYRQHSVFIAEAGDAGIREKLIVRRRPAKRTVQQRVKKKMCHRVKGADRMMSKRPLHHVKFKSSFAPRRQGRKSSS